MYFKWSLQIFNTKTLNKTIKGTTRIQINVGKQKLNFGYYGNYYVFKKKYCR